MRNFLAYVLSLISWNLNFNTNQPNDASISIEKSFYYKNIHLLDSVIGVNSGNLEVHLKTNPFLIIYKSFLRIFKTTKGDELKITVTGFILGDNRLFILGFSILSFQMVLTTYYNVWVWGEKITGTRVFDVEISDNQLMQKFDYHFLLPSIFVSEATINNISKINQIEPRFVLATFILQRRKLEKYSNLIVKFIAEPILRLAFAQYFYPILFTKLFPLILNTLKLNYQQTGTFIFCVSVFLIFSYLYILFIQCCLELLKLYSQITIFIYLLALKDKYCYISYKWLRKYYQNIYQLNFYNLVINIFPNYYFGLINYYSNLGKILQFGLNSIYK